MAMCFSLVALAGVPVIINNPACVTKTFPGFFDSLKKILS
jgi:3-phosphoshikimate 1-carboxyvinyltransferase